MKRPKRWVGWRHARAASLAATAAVLAALVPYGLAEATQPMPSTSWSFYVTSTNGNSMYTLGYNQGVHDRQVNQNSEVIIDFGQQDVSGAGAWEAGHYVGQGVYFSNGTITGLGDEFASGYYNGTGSDYWTILTLVLGTNNGVSCAGQPAGQCYGIGQNWGNNVTSVRNWANANNVSSQVHIWGGDDIEPAYGTWTDEQNWVYGFLNNSGAPYVNFGSADNCPNGYVGGDAACTNGWMVSQIAWVSWTHGGNTVQPDMYFSPLQAQWQGISCWTKVATGGPIYFQGPLSTYRANNSYWSPSASWNNFWGQLNSDPRTAVNFSPGYSMDIGWQ